MISPADIELFAATIERLFGFPPDPSRRDDLEVIFAERLSATGNAADPARYLDRLAQASPNDPAELDALAALLTVPETYFFRMPDHFTALTGYALPAVLRANTSPGHRPRHAGGKPTLRILSAGCATGEEPYTIAILLHERFPQLRDWDVEIVGIDLSRTALDRARSGLYTEWSLRATSPERRTASFTRVGGKFQLVPAIRNAVDFRPANLLDLPDLGGPFDIIFCRNVLIYFTPTAVLQAIDGLTDILVPGGFLFLGPAETLRGISRNFHLLHTHEAFFYQRKDGFLQASPAPYAAPSPVSRPATPPARTPVPDTSGNADWYDAILRSSTRLDSLFDPSLTPEPPRAKHLPSAPSPLPNPPAPGFDMDQFLALAAAERFSQAIDMLDLLPPGSASTEDLRLMRAVMLTNLNRRDESERECKLLLEADELNAGAHYLMGLCREQAGSLPEALEHARMAIYLDPTFAMAHLHHGLLSRRLRHPATAADSLHRALTAIDHEPAPRLTLFAGGFSRKSLRELCLRELNALPASPSAAEKLPAHAEPTVRATGTRA
jgi:chemotaxis protein methyltransferase CheR